MGYHPKPSSCVGCPAYFAGKSFVPPTDRPDPRLIIIGQGPGQDEALDGKPFVGISGRKLDSWLLRAGVSRHECAISNVVWCWLPGNRPGTAAEVAHCRAAHWGSWLDANRSSRVVVVLVGQPAATAVLGKKASPGTVHRLPTGQFALVIAHPAYILRGNWSEEPLQIEYLKLAKEIADGLDYDPRPESHLPRDIISHPKLSDLDRWRADLSGEGIAVDIETAGDHICLIGLCDVASLRYLGFPIRSVGGGQYWNPSELPIAVQWLWTLLADESIPKFFHNGQAFDVPVLERNGFLIHGYEFDTMLGMHIAATGVPKDLETLAGVFLKMPAWKHLAGEVEGEGK